MEKKVANRSAAAQVEMNLGNSLANAGYCVIRTAFPPERIDAVLCELAQAFARDTTDSVLRADDGSIYGARNLLDVWPGVADAWRQAPSPLPEIVAEVLGSNFGLVRVLFFDKPPERSWVLPWHQDKTIAVKDNRLPSDAFRKPTFKAGVPHIEAPAWLLENMLTLRWHLDDVTDENGPLQVLPGSHRGGPDEAGPVTILAQRGDVLLMRPLVSHSSNRSHAETKRHRRILHYEFAGVEELPDGFRWHDFLRPPGPVAASAPARR